MDGNNASREPWYRYGWVRFVGVMLLVMTVGAVSVYQYINYLFYRPIQVTRGPWQVLDPGLPVEPLKFEVLEEGNGPVVEPGDLIQVSLGGWSNQQGDCSRASDWWVWTGFRTDKETPFHSIDPKLVSAFVGLMEGEG